MSARLSQHRKGISLIEVAVSTFLLSTAMAMVTAGIFALNRAGSGFAERAVGGRDLIPLFEAVRTDTHAAREITVNDAEVRITATSVVRYTIGNGVAQRKASDAEAPVRRFRLPKGASVVAEVVELEDRGFLRLKSVNADSAPLELLAEIGRNARIIRRADSATASPAEAEGP